MSLLKRNIAANFAGSICQTLMGLIFVPFYIQFMGIESWGLIGLFTTLQPMLGLFDMGLSSTLNREMARLSVLPEKKQEMRDLLRTLEVLNWGLAVLVGVIAFALSQVITDHWIKAEKLTPKTIEQALVIMGCVIALQFPAGFYSGGLMGLQEQVTLNVINVVISILRGGGAVLILWLKSPTIQAFFLWQIVISILNILCLALFLWRRLAFGNNTAVFQKHLLSGIWRFAAGMSGITITTVILTQLDKLILSKMLALEMFGYYTLASVVGMSLSRLFTPVFYSIYPRLTQLATTKDEDGLKLFYHNSCQFFAVLVLPAAIVVALFSYDILFLWTQNPTTAEKTHLIVSFLVLGTALNGLMNTPYALQLANGWTSLSVLKNVVAVILFGPLIIVMTTQYGAIGAAFAWLILNLCYVLFEIPIMHRRLLRNEKWRWYWQDAVIPFLSGFSLAYLGKIAMTGQMSQFMTLSYLTTISILTLSITALATPVTRSWLFEQLCKNKMLCRK